MKILSVLLLLIFTQLAFSQATNPNDTYKIGSSSSSDKGLIFETGDGASNKKLTVEKATKMMKFDGNSFQLGDGALTQDKKIIFNGTSGAYLMYDKTNLEVSTNSNVAIDAGKKLKTNSIDTKSGTEVAIEQNARVKGNLNLGTGNNQLRVNAGNLEFSNDGSLYKKIGSGGGGGSGGSPINTNGSFEDGVSSGWTSSGGTFAQASYTGNPPDSDLKYASFTATGAGQYFETSLFTTPQFMVGGCLGKLDYYSTDASGTWKVQIYDSSSNLLKEVSLDPKNWQSGYAGLPCPTVGTQIKLRVISTAAGTIFADRVELGKESRTFQVAQAKLAGESNIMASTGCLWTRSSATIGPFTATAACLGPTIAYSSMGQWQTTDSDLPRQTINNLPAGTYKATFYVPQYSGSSNQVSLAINDGTSTCVAVQGETSATLQSLVVVSCTFTYTTAGNRVFEVYGAGNAGANVNITNTNPVPSSAVKFQLDYSPNDSQTALVPEAQDWMIDVNIGGSNFVNSSTQATYVPWLNASVDMVLNSGSAPATIPCSGTNASTGLTCATGSEALGVVFTPPQAGWYEICGEFGTAIAPGNTITNQWVETPINAETILTEGKSRSGTTNSGANPTTIGSAQRTCANFKFDSATPRALRLYFESSSTPTATIYSDRDGTAGQRDVHIIVRQISGAFNRPYLVGDPITTPGATKPKLLSIHFGSGANCATTCTGIGTVCTICNQNGSSITSVVSQNTSGLYRMFGIDGTKYNCTGTGVGATYNAITHNWSTSTTSYAELQSGSSGTGTSGAFNTVFCHSKD